MAKKSSAKTPAGMTAEEVIVRANIKRETISSEHFVSLYSNDTQIQISPWDFRFMFGIIASMPSAADQSVVVKEIGEVRMSPQHAKMVVKILIRQIENYEKNIGPIPQPEA